MFFSNKKRDQICQTLSSQTFDVLVIGGGLTGAGIALDASSRGMKVAVVDMQDFAAGTSSRTTKIIPGGISYSNHTKVKNISILAKERETIYHNAPHITTPMMLLRPYYRNETTKGLTKKIKSKARDAIVGVKREQSYRSLSKKVTLQKEPLLKEKQLRGSAYYEEYVTDDARLTIEILKKSCQLGAIALNYLKVFQLIYSPNGKVKGVEIEDQITGDIYKISAKKVVNATGNWINTIRPVKGEKALELTYFKSINLVFDHCDFSITQATAFTSRGNRTIFAIPRNEKVYVGTTNQTYRGGIVNPEVTKEDETCLISAINDTFPDVQLSHTHIRASWAGVFPSSNKMSNTSFQEGIKVDESGLFSIITHQLTSYRKLAEQTVNLIVQQLKEENDILYQKSETKVLPVSGGDPEGPQGFKVFKEKKLLASDKIPLAANIKAELINRYGTNVDEVWNYVSRGEHSAKTYQIDLPVFAELNYALEHECIYKPSDFFIRRTAAIYFDPQLVQRNLSGVTHYLSTQLQWSPEELTYYTRECRQLLIKYRGGWNKTSFNE